jgi:hypothetical protein
MACEHYDYTHKHTGLRERFRYGYDRTVWLLTKVGLSMYAIHAVAHVVLKLLGINCF